MSAPGEGVVSRRDGGEGSRCRGAFLGWRAPGGAGVSPLGSGPHFGLVPVSRGFGGGRAARAGGVVRGGPGGAAQMRAVEPCERRDRELRVSAQRRGLHRAGHGRGAGSAGSGPGPRDAARSVQNCFWWPFHPSPRPSLLCRNYCRGRRKPRQVACRTPLAELHRGSGVESSLPRIPGYTCASRIAPVP